MKTSPLTSALTALLLSVTLPRAGTTTVYSERFGPRSSCDMTVRGKCRPGDLGLHLAPDSRLAFEFEQGTSIRTGAIQVTFIPPDLSSLSLTPIGGSGDCFCAFKVRAGLVEAEVTERWVRLQRYEERVTHVGEVYGEVQKRPPSGTDELEVTLAFDHGKATVSVNGEALLHADDVPADLSDVRIATYGHPFHVTGLEVWMVRLDTLRVDARARTVEVAARYHPRRFNRGVGLKQHHFIVWEGGKAAGSALFSTAASDSAVHQALVEAGAKPGNNLKKESWTKRSSKSDAAPNIRVDGSRLKLEIVYGEHVLAPSEVLGDRAGHPYDFRFGGNLALIPVWHSGCVVCLQSCPGGKVGNRTYTMRDLALGAPKFAIAPKVPLLPEDEVLLRFTVLD